MHRWIGSVREASINKLMFFFTNVMQRWKEILYDEVNKSMNWLITFFSIFLIPLATRWKTENCSSMFFFFFIYIIHKRTINRPSTVPPPPLPAKQFIPHAQKYLRVSLPRGSELVPIFSTPRQLATIHSRTFASILYHPGFRFHRYVYAATRSNPPPPILSFLGAARGLKKGVSSRLPPPASPLEYVYIYEYVI